MRGSNQHSDMGDMELMLQGLPGVDISVFQKPRRQSPIKQVLSQIIHVVPNILHYFSTNIKNSVSREQDIYHATVTGYNEEFAAEQLPPLSEVKLPDSMSGYSKEFHIGDNTILMSGDISRTYAGRTYDQDTSTWSVRS